MSGSTIQVTGKAASVFFGVISLIYTFVPKTGIPWWGRILLFVLGFILISAGTGD